MSISFGHSGLYGSTSPGAQPEVWRNKNSVQRCRFVTENSVEGVHDGPPAHNLNCLNDLLFLACLWSFSPLRFSRHPSPVPTKTRGEKRRKRSGGHVSISYLPRGASVFALPPPEQGLPGRFELSRAACCGVRPIPSMEFHVESRNQHFRP